MRLAYFSPLPPAATGVADYSATLLPALAAQGDVDVFTESPAAALDARLTVRPVSDFAERRGAYDARLYHLGNSDHYGAIRETLIRFPGVLALHDGTLHHGLVDRTLHRGDASGYLREMTYAHGAAGFDAALAVGRGSFLYPFYRYPVLKRPVDAATTVIVHSAAIAAAVRAARPEAPIVQIDHLAFPPPAPRLPREKLREELGLAREAFLVAAFGPPAFGKRVEATLRAFARFAAGEPRATFAWVGARPDAFEVRQAIHELGLQGRVRLTGWVSLERLYDYIQVTDAAINLRFPTTGEASGMVMRLLAAGVPTLVTAAGWFAELPAEAAAAVPAGAGEEEAIAARLRAWMADADLRAQQGAAARAYAEPRTVGRAAEEYWQVLKGGRRGE